MTKNHLILVLMTVALSFTACDKDDPVIPNEEEVITTVNYSLTPVGGGTTVVLSFQDLDGDGGNAPVVTGATLDANQTYTAVLDLLNESESPVGSVTEEIQAEAEDHQFFFQSDVAGLAVTYNDLDADGKPIGLSTTLTTGAVASGNLTVTLKHKPTKTAAGVADGDITNANGETDIEVIFPIDVQ